MDKAAGLRKVLQLSMRIISCIALLSAPLLAVEAPDFNREVRPILSRHCLKCHGPDAKARKGELRLDTREGALAPAESGARAVVPGNVKDSELIKRIFHADEDERMPPRSAKQPLPPEKREILKRWIESGAEYREHWAFIPPKKVAPPGNAANPIDAFVSAKTKAAGLVLSPEADAATLCRRIYLDLTGLPPTPAEVAAFAKSAGANRDAAVSALADELLASPRYGERWARKWLDLARYADTNGYEKDRPRSIWPYRDWVIRALNADMPFDQFTIEQIAGDMLPGATIEQRVATGFHRNTMLNEEGGIDPLEFRFAAIVDRVATTGMTWLGLTVGCAQCHAHKYDPIQHAEYFRMFAFLNNADELDLDLPPPEAEQQKQREARAGRLLAELPEKWPLQTAAAEWATPKPAATARSGAKPGMLADGSMLFAKAAAESDSYTITLDAKGTFDRIRIETLTDPSLPSKGPGRAANGNFVLSEVTVTSQAGDSAAAPVKLIRAEADIEQGGWPASAAIDGRQETGWGADEKGKKLNANHAAVFTFEHPLAGARKFTVRLDQAFGKQHTIGRVRVSLGSPVKDARTAAERRNEALERAFSKWLEDARAKAVQWTPLRPASAISNLPLLTILPDASVLGSGDISKNDTYTLRFENPPRGITAIRLEVLPHESLPGHGPGMAYYEGPKGDFFMGEFQLGAEGRPVKFARASESYSKNNFGSLASAALATDGDPQTGWSCAGLPGEPHEAVFVPAEPVNAASLDLKLVFGRHYACSLGHFRISVTTTPGGTIARQPVGEIESLLAMPAGKLDAAQTARLREHFLLSTPELAAPAREIRELRKPEKFSTTLVMSERPPANPRPTFIHNRGEFLQPTERVEPGVLGVLNQLPENTPRDRLAFARWLVSRENPVTARVVVNRAWASFFGRGIVSTTEDFGIQGEPPSHPELLDWLAVEFMERGWSFKKLHKLIVTSATYRQSSKVPPAALTTDPGNRLLSHFPRVRLEAEIIRDSALRASGLLAEKIGGPSVRPPQPAGVTEVAFGSPRWNADSGEARYRRSLYTYAKRTAPFALYNTFDAPAGEACLTRRDVSNTPLQALSLLNDEVFLEACRSLGKQLAEKKCDDRERANELFMRLLSRLPGDDEAAAVLKFFEAQKARFAGGEIQPAKMMKEEKGATAEQAAWSAVVRAILNLDENVTKG